MDGKTLAAGNTYRGEAATLIVEAARREQQTPLAASSSGLAATAPVVKPDVPRALPYAEPRAINDNVDGPGKPLPREVEPPRRSPLRAVAWLLVLPFYLAGLALSVGIIGLFAKNLLGL